MNARQINHDETNVNTDVKQENEVPARPILTEAPASPRLAPLRKHFCKPPFHCIGHCPHQENIHFPNDARPVELVVTAHENVNHQEREGEVDAERDEHRMHEKVIPMSFKKL